MKNKMMENPREYKRRVDAEWRKNERNKNKLIKKIKEYELLDDLYKKKVEKEILEVFLENEKKEKGKNYNDMTKLVEEADKKYEMLDQLRNKLKLKEEERVEVEEKIKDAKFDGVDNTIMDKQMKEFDDLVEGRESLGKEIEEIKKEILDMEEEIKDAEEIYGKRLEIDDKTEDENIEEDEVTINETEEKQPTTLKGYHNQTIKDLWDKDRKRKEIIKILEEGAGIKVEKEDGSKEEDLVDEIKKEVTKKFFEYYDEKQGSLRMKAGRREKNKLKERDRGEDIEKWQEEEKTEEIVGTPREKREKLILQWYEKKLNRDELLRILEEEVIMDKKSKKELKEGIMKDFYENYEKAKGENEYQIADAEYRDIKRTTKGLKGKKKELEKKKEERRIEIEGIDEEMQGIGQKAMKLENGSWWNKRKLERFKTRRDELDKQERKIKDEIGKLEMDKLELQLSLKDKEGKYGPKIRWELDRPEKVERKISKEQEESEEEQTTLKGYKERYEQTVKDKEEYNQKLLGAVRDMDMGISEEKKREVLENIELNMKKEIEDLKEGDETTKEAEEIERWLKEDWETTMGKIVELKNEMKKVEKQIQEISSKEVGEDINMIVQIKKKEGKLRKEMNELKDEYEQAKSDLEEKLKRYDGTLISEEDFVVETFEERERRLLKRKIKEMYPYKGVDIEEVKVQETLEGYREKYEEMIKDKKEYNEQLLEVVKDMDIGISEEEKEKLLMELNIEMRKEIEGRKKSMKIADGMGKWLKENCSEMLLGLSIQNSKILIAGDEETELLKHIYNKFEDVLKGKISSHCGKSVEVGDVMIIGGEVAFYVKSKDGCYIYRGDTCVYRECEEIGGFRPVGDKPFFQIKDGDGDYAIYRGDDKIGLSTEEIKDIQVVGDKPVFQIRDGDGDYAIYRGDDRICYWSTEEIKDIQIVGDKPLFQIKDVDDGEYYMYRGDECNGEGSKEEIKDIQIIGDKPFFQIKDGDGDFAIYRGTDQICYFAIEEVKEIKDIQAICNKPFFQIRHEDGEYAIYRGTDQIGGWSKEAIKDIQIVGDKPLFQIKDRGGKYTIYRGADQIYYGSVEEIKNIQMLGDKPLFQIKDSDLKYYMYRGDQRLNDGWTWSTEEIKDIQIIGDKPLFQIKDKDSYYRIYRGDQYNHIGSTEAIKDIQIIGDKPLFKVKNSDGNYGVYRGTLLCGKLYKKIGEVQEVEGKPLFKYEDESGEEGIWVERI